MRRTPPRRRNTNWEGVRTRAEREPPRARRDSRTEARRPDQEADRPSGCCPPPAPPLEEMARLMLGGCSEAAGGRGPTTDSDEDGSEDMVSVGGRGEGELHKADPHSLKDPGWRPAGLDDLGDDLAAGVEGAGAAP